MAKRGVLLGGGAVVAALALGLVVGVAIGRQASDDSAGEPPSAEAGDETTTGAPNDGDGTPEDSADDHGRSDDDGGDGDRDAAQRPEQPGSDDPQFDAAAPSGLPAAVVTDGMFIETFDGAPAEPTPWRSGSWDVTVHSRDIDTWDRLEPVEAQHGPTCGPPSETHTVVDYRDTVFQCRDHVMTALNTSGYGVIYLTPAALVDFSDGPATVSVDVSTLRMSGRDWWDIWITPYDEHLQLPLDVTLPDLHGNPMTGVNVRMNFNDNNFHLSVFRDGLTTEHDSYEAYDFVLEPDPARRDTFELVIGDGTFSFGMPDYDLWWFRDQPVDLEGWSSGVVQFGHHSYTPTKDGAGTPATWHWDNIAIAPATPFTMSAADRLYVGGGEEEQRVRFDHASGPRSHLRFAGIGSDLEVSFDDGASWQPARRQPSYTEDGELREELFRSYWMPVPEGVDAVLFRGADWWGGEWRVRDISIWTLP